MRSKLDQIMRIGWIFGIGLVVLSVLASAPARAEGPGADVKLLEDMKNVFAEHNTKARMLPKPKARRG